MKLELIICLLSVTFLFSTQTSGSEQLEHHDFLKGGRFSCLSQSNCNLPSIADLDVVKKRFQDHAEGRLNYIKRLNREFNTKIENILALSQSVDSVELIDFYQTLGSSLNSSLEKLRVDTALALINRTSPFVHELNDLQGVLSGQLRMEQKSDKMSNRQKYMKWLKRPSFLQLLESMAEVEKDFLNIKSFSIDTSHMAEIFPIISVSCPKDLERATLKELFRYDLLTNSTRLKNILWREGHSRPITIKCRKLEKGVALGRSRYIKSTHTLLLPYRKEKQRSVSPTRNMFKGI